VIGEQRKASPGSEGVAFRSTGSSAIRRFKSCAGIGFRETRRPKTFEDEEDDDEYENDWDYPSSVGANFLSHAVIGFA
jgi:hypothetical protein